jgi:hypothetical protein
MGLANMYLNSNMIVTQQRQIVHGQGKACFLKQLANGIVEWLFVRQNRIGMKPSFTELTL